jgi:F0F1-type ATP synthase membrane subunit b/b'
VSVSVSFFLFLSFVDVFVKAPEEGIVDNGDDRISEVPRWLG